MLNEILKICEKILSDDVNANRSNKKQNIWWLYLTNFYKKYSYTFKM